MSRVFVFVATALAAFAPPAVAKDAKPLVIEHVHVLPMTAGGAAIDDATVVISNGRIASHHPRREGARTARRAAHRRPRKVAAARVLRHARAHRQRPHAAAVSRRPEDRRRSGRTQDYLTPFIANGVTQVFNLSAMSESISQRSDVEIGPRAGPPHRECGHDRRIAAIVARRHDACRGDARRWPAGGARRTGRGYEFIKVYSKLSLETFTAIVDEARKLEMRVRGPHPAA